MHQGARNINLKQKRKITGDRIRTADFKKITITSKLYLNLDSNHFYCKAPKTLFIAKTFHNFISSTLTFSFHIFSLFSVYTNTTKLNHIVHKHNFTLNINNTGMRQHATKGKFSTGNIPSSCRQIFQSFSVLVDSLEGKISVYSRKDN